MDFINNTVKNFSGNSDSNDTLREKRDKRNNNTTAPQPAVAPQPVKADTDNAAPVKEKKTDVMKGSNWKAFGQGLLSTVIIFLLIVINGLAILYHTKVGIETNPLPINIDKLPYNPAPGAPFSETMPYVHYPKDPDIFELFSRIIASSMSSIRVALTTLFLAFKVRSSRSKEDEFSTLDYLLFIYGIGIIGTLSFFLPFVGVMGGIMGYLMSDADIEIKFFALFFIFFILWGCYMFQSVYVWLFLISGIYWLYAAKKLGTYLKEFKHIIYWMLVLTIVIPCASTLWYPITIGVVLGALSPYFTTLFKILFIN